MKKNEIIEIYYEEFILKNGTYEPENRYENIFEAYKKTIKSKESNLA